MIKEIHLPLEGIQRAYRIMQISDSHLCEWDDRNPEFKDHMEKRKARFGDPLGVFQNLLKVSIEREVDFLALTGDIIDVPTEANIEMLQGLMEGFEIPWGLTFGNHEWCKIPPKDRSYWWEKFSWVPHSLESNSFSLKDIKLFFVDNSDYQINEKQVAHFGEVLNEGEPVIIFLHIPTSLPTLYHDTVAIWNDPIMMGDKTWSKGAREKYLIPEQQPASTTRFLELLHTHKNVAGLFSGHLHFHHRDELLRGCYQYVATGSFTGAAKMIQVEPAGG